MRSRDERWVVTIWQPEKAPVGAGTSPAVVGSGLGFFGAVDHKLRRTEYEIFGAMSFELGLRDRPICERAVLINGRLVTVRKQREEA